MVSRRTAVVAAFLAGLAVGGLAVTAVVPTERSLDPESPPHSIATASGCLPDSYPDVGNWVFTTSSDDGELMVLNLTVEHPPNRTVETDLSYVGNGSYRFSIRTVEAEKAGTPDCPTGSTVELSATFPDGFDSVTVVRDGEEVTTVQDTPDSGPTLRWLNVSGS
ncbi:hypothetical protein VB773_17050 [Haloarculaceae archaeon H-GB2-1]|nr:hypothetical protein [Haloarculaceae archaeon H-GB1-1]MEA5387620.1 hypothetical protein [Haloarculaceae archaeon H-GB11]MEA5409108.1 hypothetical protein [Haloarculaceae archaeon H-GB2-1]